MFDNIGLLKHLILEDILTVMVQIKFFEASSLGYLEVRVNEFLERIDKKNIINVSIATSEQESIHPTKANYIAGILYEESNKEILE